MKTAPDQTISPGERQHNIATGRKHRCCGDADLASPVRRIAFMSREDVIRIGRSLWTSGSPAKDSIEK